METVLWTLVYVVVIAASGGLGLYATARRNARAERRLALLERKLDAVLDHLGVPFDEPVVEQVEAYLREGRKIQAIAVYRDRTGVGLAEAKDAVERMAGGRAPRR